MMTDNKPARTIKDIEDELLLLLRCPSEVAPDILKCRLAIVLAMVDVGRKLPFAIRHVISSAWMNFKLWECQPKMSKDQCGKCAKQIIKGMAGEYPTLFVKDFFNDLRYWLAYKDQLDDYVACFIDNVLSNVVKARILLPDVNQLSKDIDAFASMVDNVQHICREIQSDHTEWLVLPKELKIYDCK